MSLTTDRNDPDLNIDNSITGQAKKYLILSDEERAKGFVRPYRDTYRHIGEKPKYPLRDLTEAEHGRYGKFGYVKCEDYPEGDVLQGRFWTQAQLDATGCYNVTTMARPIAETYARDPSFYGLTFCCHCGKHLPIREFVWMEENGSDGPVLGS